jgi:hypothetical protein
LYVPAGVPVVVEVVLLEEQPNWNTTRAKKQLSSAAISTRCRRDFLPPMPTPSNANPETGNSAA